VADAPQGAACHAVRETMTMANEKDCICCCDDPKLMPELNKYLVALEGVVLECALALGIALPPKPRISTNSSGGTGGSGDGSAGWGNGDWP
jgi:hypothetical protein